MRMKWVDRERKYRNWTITDTGASGYPFTFVHKDFRGIRETAHLQGVANSLSEAKRKIDMFELNKGSGEGDRLLT